MKAPLCPLCGETDILKFRARVIKNKTYYVKHCRNCESFLSREYYKNNKEERAEYQKQYRSKNEVIVKSKKKDYDKKRYNNLKPQIISNVRKYRKDNRALINKAKKDRRKNDPAYRLRYYISNRIRKILNQSSSRKNNSCLKYLSYSFKELKEHIESQFESWMSWENHGSYDPETWKDDDPSTWVWSLDHIIPQSDLPYASMEDENFKKCWTLENLRPLSAKQNFLDGINRVRHDQSNK